MTDTHSLPQGWVWTKLGDICKKSQYGWTTKATNEGNLHLLRTTDITSGSINWETVPFCSKEPENKEKYLLKDGDILISRAGSVGYSYLIQNPDEAVFASYLIRFKPINVNPRYLAFFLQSPDYWQAISEKKLGIAIPNVNATKLSDIDLPLPPLTEQQRIVAKVEELFTQLDAGVAELQQAIAKLGRYRQAVLKAAVEGELTREWREAHQEELEPASELLERILQERREKWEQGELAKMQAKGKESKDDKWKAKYKEPAPPDMDGLPQLPEGWVWAVPEQLASPEKYSLAIGPFGSNLKVSDYTDEGVPLVFVRNIRSGVFDGPDTRFVSDVKAEELKAHQVVGDDILITKMGEPPGDACLYPTTRPSAIITADCVKWTLTEHLPAKRFFVHAVNSALIRSQIIKITKGVAQKKISLTRFKTIAIPVPPIAEQEIIAAKVERRMSVADEIEEEIDQALARAEWMRQAILKRAFEGKLVEQHPEDGNAVELIEKINSSKQY